MNHIFLEIAFVITVMYCNTKHSCWGFADPNDCSTGVLRHVSLRRVIPLLLPTAVLNYLSGSAESCWKALKQRQGTQIDVEEKENPVNWKEGYFQMERWTDEQLLTICNSSGFFFWPWSLIANCFFIYKNWTSGGFYCFMWWVSWIMFLPYVAVRVQKLHLFQPLSKNSAE